MSDQSLAIFLACVMLLSKNACQCGGANLWVSKRKLARVCKILDREHFMSPFSQSKAGLILHFVCRYVARPKVQVSMTCCWLSPLMAPSAATCRSFFPPLVENKRWIFYLELQGIKYAMLLPNRPSPWQNREDEGKDLAPLGGWLIVHPHWDGFQ